MSKLKGLKNGFRKGYRKGYRKGFDDGIKMCKSLFEPKLPEVNKNYELEQLNDLIYRPERPKICLNCDFYKNTLPAVNRSSATHLVNGVKISRTKSVLPRPEQVYQLK